MISWLIKEVGLKNGAVLWPLRIAIAGVANTPGGAFEIAGLLGREENGVLDVALDYSTPAYRDSSEGRYLVEHLGQEGVKLLRYEHAEDGHLGYLKKLGYEQKNGAWERAL